MAIVVSGATGTVGGEVVRQLVAAGAPVRAIVRDPARAALPPEADVVVGDLGDPGSVRDAAAGAEAAFVHCGYAGVDGALLGLVAAGLERVVVLSSSAAPSGDRSNAIARYHIDTEEAVRRSGAAWTFLRPNTFMTNTLRWADQLRAGDVVRAPFPDVAVSTIDPADIAAVAVRGLLTDELEGRALRLSGSQALTPGERVALLGRALGRDLRYVGLTDDEARAELAPTMPAEYLAAIFSFFADGAVDETTVWPTVAEVLGRAPRTFGTWADAHRDRFAYVEHVTDFSAVRPL
jgi:uncharacterized protein YbjT (DUF2867 family)